MAGLLEDLEDGPAPDEVELPSQHDLDELELDFCTAFAMMAGHSYEDAVVEGTKWFKEARE